MKIGRKRKQELEDGAQQYAVERIIGVSKRNEKGAILERKVLWTDGSTTSEKEYRLNACLSEVKYNNWGKNLANGKFAQAASEFCNRGGYVLILDGPDMCTSKHLVEDAVGFCASQIVVPNCFDYDELKKTQQDYPHLAAVDVHELDLHNFLALDMLPENSVPACWFDFTRTLMGNKRDRQHPIDDLKLFFAKRWPQNECVFAVTVSSRSRGNKDCLNVLAKTVQKLARKAGFRQITELFRLSYRMMVFVLFKLSR